MRVLALDVGGTAIKSALFQEEQLIRSMEIPSEGKLGKAALISNIHKCISAYEGFDAIGISTSGQVDQTKGTIIKAGNSIPDYSGTPLKESFERAYQVPVYVENDVNAAALGELYYGGAVDLNDFLCVTYGTGIGGAIVINREIYRGFSSVAGEFGHILTHPEGELCACGQRGCYEQYASTKALVRRAKAYNPSLTDGRRIMEKLGKLTWDQQTRDQQIRDQQTRDLQTRDLQTSDLQTRELQTSDLQTGDQQTRDQQTGDQQTSDLQLEEIMDEWLTEVAYGLVTLIHIFNPSCIVLGGGIFCQTELIHRMQNLVDRQIMESFRPVTLKSAQLDNLAGVYGMLAIVEHGYY